MKKIHVFLSVVAFLFAIGGAIASSNFAPNTVAYKFIDNAPPIPDLCQSFTVTCQTLVTSFPCQTVIGGPILRELNSPSTACGQAMWRTDAPPAH